MRVIYKTIIEKIEDAIDFAEENDKEIKVILLSARDMHEFKRKNLKPIAMSRGFMLGNDAHGFFYRGVKVKEE